MGVKGSVVGYVGAIFVFYVIRVMSNVWCYEWCNFSFFPYVCIFRVVGVVSSFFFPIRHLLEFVFYIFLISFFLYLFQFYIVVWYLLVFFHDCIFPKYIITSLGTRSFNVSPLSAVIADRRFPFHHHPQLCVVRQQYIFSAISSKSCWMAWITFSP